MCSALLCCLLSAVPPQGTDFLRFCALAVSDFISIWMGDLKGKVGVLHEVVLVIHSVTLSYESISLHVMGGCAAGGGHF